MFAAVEEGRVWRSGHGQGWALLAVTLFIVIAWPPTGGKSLALQFTNWVVDPSGQLPTLPRPLGFGVGDDYNTVEAHDWQVRRYFEIYDRGGWSRRRLELKVADDPILPATERQLLMGFGALAGFLVWRFGAAR